MSDTYDGWFVAGLVAGCAVLFAVRVVLFQASCSLADAGDLHLGKAILLALVALLLCAQVAWGYRYLKEVLPSSEATMFGPAEGAMTLLTAGIAFVLPAILYVFLIPTPLKKGVLIAGFEVLLGSLLAALVTGVVLVILAGVQVVRRPAQASAAPNPAVHLRSS